MANVPDSCRYVKKYANVNDRFTHKVKPTSKIKYCARIGISINSTMYADTNITADNARVRSIPAQTRAIPGLYGVPSFLKTRFFIRMVGCLKERIINQIIDPSNSNEISVEISIIISSKDNPLLSPLIMFSKNM